MQFFLYELWGFTTFFIEDVDLSIWRYDMKAFLLESLYVFKIGTTKSIYMNLKLRNDKKPNEIANKY